MCSPIEIAHCAALAEAGFLRAGFALTIVALAFIIRQPRKTARKQEEK